MVTKEITLYAWKEQRVLIKAVQGEANGRFLLVTLCGRDIPINLTGKSAALYLKKPDGTEVFHACAVEDAAKGVVSVALTSQMSAVAGMAKDVEIRVTGPDNATLKFKGIVLEFLPSDYDSAVESANEFTLLTQTIAQAGRAIENAGAAAASATEAAEKVAKSAEAANTAAGTANTAAQTANTAAGAANTAAQTAQTAAGAANTAGDFATNAGQVAMGAAADAQRIVNQWNGIGASTLQNQINAIPRSNLLDNWHFGHPVNQRGQSVYTTSRNRIYTVDRWFISGTNGETRTVRVVDGGLQMDAGTVLVQRFETVEWDGKTVTFSVIINGQAYSYTFTWNSGLKYESGPTWPNGWRIGYSGTDPFVQIQRASGSASDVLSAAKLELGETSTLQNSPPPNFAQELLKCQRYYCAVRTEDESVPYHPQTLYATDTEGEMLVLAQPKATMRKAPMAGNNYSIVQVYLNGVARGGKVTLRDSIDGSTATGTFAQFNNNAPGMMVPFRLEGATTHAGHIYEATIEWSADL